MNSRLIEQLEYLDEYKDSLTMSLHQPVHNLDRLGFPHFLVLVHHLDTVGAVVLVHTHDALLGAV